MKLKDWLVPREERFFEILHEQSAIVVEGADALVAMLEGYDPAARREHKRRIKEIEHKGDLKSHEIYTALNATFITPLDREDLARLTSALDDVLDCTYTVANHLHLYDVRSVPKELVHVSHLLRDQARHLDEVLVWLPDPSKRQAIAAKLVEIHALENQADELTDRAKADLFHQEDVKLILQMKDILEFLERATDKAEDAADVVRDVLVKHQ
ncbi:MAG TPA: DUF47 family protein [Candidatus Thermoplasmatota archaeon]|nr:DUF47 family protein [Candidatus Thermoplasmatota archaeon]